MPPAPLDLSIDGKAPAYILQTGDTIEFKFFYVPNLNEEVVIRPDGMVSLQLIGEVRAAGLTPAKLEQDVVRRYTGVIQEPEITVMVRKYTESLIYIGGEVMRPGSIVLNRPTSVLQAVLSSGDFTDNAELRNVVVLRQTGDAGNPIYMSLNLRDYIAGTSVEPVACDTEDCAPLQGYQVVGDIYLQANDVVFVPEAKVSQVAEFLDQYIGKIIPIYRNMGLSFNVELNDKDNISLGN